MAIPAGVILIWPSTHASIPTGWERETTLDDKFPKAWGDSVAPNQTGGSNTHTHAGGHTHTLTAHAHTVAYNSVGDTPSANGGSWISSAHNHASSNTNTTSGGGLQSNGSWASSNNEPPYYTVIFVKPSGVVAPLPAGICAHYYGSSAPILWNFCDGTNSTPDLRNKYLKGAATGADAGTTGGATSHLHTITHTHTANSHAHTGTTGGVIDSYGGREDGGVHFSAQVSHTHPVTLDATVDNIANYTKTDAGGDTVEPAYKKLGVIKATVGTARKGIVGLWLGSIASIPVNWVLCDGNNDTYDMRDKFVKIGTALTNNNETGGANTHTHSAVSHTHSPSSAHTHTGSTANTTSNQNDGNGSEGVVYSPHTHSLASVSSVSSSYSTDNITADTVNNEPAYRTAAYIQLNKVDLGGSFLFNMV